ncbi:MAG: asparaginase [Bacillota bacterium]|nr:asparaginase [Bacillota bacterium]MDW7683616.1 asparaginase [Bacillota bacterium]
MSEILVEVTRGGMVESIHRGDLVAVDTRGSDLFHLGNAHKKTYWRSAAKPFQVLPLVEAGGMERFGLTPEELALMTSSHSGEERHIAAAKSILTKIDQSAEVLECGIAPPMSKRAANEILKQGRTFTTLTNPCCGKHTAMIALAIVKGLDISGYAQPIHPVQHEMLRTIADISGLMPKDITIGIDGCGVPVFGMPLFNMAIAYAHLSRPNLCPEPRKTALGTIASAMVKHPFMVAGSKRLDTDLMEATQGRILAKLGAEGIYCVSVMEEGIGIALKIEDGNSRAIDPVIIEVLNRMGFLSPDELAALRSRQEGKIRNNRKETVGIIRHTF